MGLLCVEKCEYIALGMLEDSEDWGNANRQMWIVGQSMEHVGEETK